MARSLRQAEALTKPPQRSVPRPVPKDGALDLVRRYYEAHGRWEDQIHRTGTAGTVTTRVLVACACPICADARALLED